MLVKFTPGGINRERSSSSSDGLLYLRGEGFFKPGGSNLGPELPWKFGQDLPWKFGKDLPWKLGPDASDISDEAGSAEYNFTYTVGAPYLLSVELLYLNDDGINEEEWMMGPELPQSLFLAKMIEYDNSVIIMDNKDLYQLSSPAGPWVKMKQRVKERKDFDKPITFLVPDEIVNCH